MSMFSRSVLSRSLEGASSCAGGNERVQLSALGQTKYPHVQALSEKTKTITIGPEHFKVSSRRHQKNRYVTRHLGLTLNRGRHRHREQSRLAVLQLAPLLGLARLEHLVRVKAVLASHISYAGAGHHLQLHNLTLLQNALLTANRSNLTQTGLRHSPIINRDHNPSPEDSACAYDGFCAAAYTLVPKK